MVSHPIRLRGLLPEAGSGPSILQRTDQLFIPAVLEELAAGDDLRRLGASLASNRDDSAVLKLRQPVQRTFNVAVLEGFCDTFGLPPLAPSAITGMGLVLRRVAQDAAGRDRPGEYEAWSSAGGSLRGWLPLQTAAEQDADPDPALRPPALNGGHPEINRRLAVLYNLTEAPAEAVSPLFAAPPDVCKRSGRSVLYGMVPVTSSEISETPPASNGYDGPEAREALRRHLYGYLRSGDHLRPVPAAGGGLSFSDIDNLDARPEIDPEKARLRSFAAFLRQVSIEFDAFGESSQSRLLLQQLDKITLRFDASGSTRRKAGDFLRQATAVLIENDAPAGTRITMPLEWPAVSAAQEQAIIAAVQVSLSAQRDRVKPREGRFDDAGRRYAVRAFIRVQREEGCPQELVWSDYSEPFTIAQWYESGDAAPVQISLPDLTDRKALKQLKPNVVFAVPENLQNILTNNTPKALASGEGDPDGPSSGMDWLCSFSIPIITLCAFIVLNVFLQLFNIIFKWMLFIKVCIPVPKKS